MGAGDQRGRDADAACSRILSISTASSADYEATQAKAEAKDVEAKEAGKNGDDYVLLTVLLAAALFFAGVTTSFKMQVARLVLLMLAAVLIAYCISRIATLARRLTVTRASASVTTTIERTSGVSSTSGRPHPRRAPAGA